MNIKLIIMDMDGTLLDKDSKITPDNYEALIEAQKKGIRLVLASGRSYKSLLKFGKELKMDEYNGYFIGVNGAAIYDCSNDTNEVIKQLDKENIKEIFDEAMRYDVEIMGVLDSTIYDYIPETVLEAKKKYRTDNNIAEDVPMTAGSFSFIADQRKGYDHIYYIDSPEDIHEKVNKICIANESEILSPVYEDLSLKFKDKYNIAKTTPRWLECNPKGISKGDTIIKLAQKLGIGKDEMIVFGDGENDLSMFGVVDYPIAMGNAMDTVKKAAYDITLDNNHDGIAYYLKKKHII